MKKKSVDMICNFCAEVRITTKDAVVAQDDAIQYLKQHPELWKLESMYSVRKPVKNRRASSAVLQ